MTLTGLHTTIVIHTAIEYDIHLWSKHICGSKINHDYGQRQQHHYQYTAVFTYSYLLHFQAPPASLSCSQVLVTVVHAFFCHFPLPGCWILSSKQTLSKEISHQCTYELSHTDLYNHLTCNKYMKLHNTFPFMLS